MAEITFAEIVEATQHLSRAQKRLLAQLLYIDIEDGPEPSRDELVAELDLLRRSGAFDQVASMRNRYANSTAPDLAEADLLSQLHEVSQEWTSELDDLDHG